MIAWSHPPQGKGRAASIGSPNTLSAALKTGTTSGPAGLPSPPGPAEIPRFLPLFLEATVKAPSPHGGWRTLTNYHSKMDCLDKM